jgi:hypothetical protein
MKNEATKASTGRWVAANESLLNPFTKGRVIFLLTGPHVTQVCAHCKGEFDLVKL